MNNENENIRNGTENAIAPREEEHQVVEACAATILYRHRRDVPVSPFHEALVNRVRRTQELRLEHMINLSVPTSRIGRRCGRAGTDVNPSAFEELIYNPSRNGLSRRILLTRDLSLGKEVFPVKVYSDTQRCDLPEDFTYICSNDFSNYTESEDNEGIAMVKCECTDFICVERCPCRKMNDKFKRCTILGDGRVYLTREATFYNTFLVGCGDKCACAGRCKNSLGAKFLPSPFKFEVFRRNDNIGFGLRTLSNIPVGSAVLEFCGEVLDEDVLSERGQASEEYAYSLQHANEKEFYRKLARVKKVQLKAFDKWIKTSYIDPKRKGNIARFITHGCLPNLTMIRYAENDLRLHRSRAILFANQPILGGSELFFDYGESYLSKGDFECECATLYCRKVAERWRFASKKEMIRTGLAYFDYIEKRMKELDERANLFLRDKGISDEGGIIDPKDDNHDEGRPPNKRCRIDRSNVHRRRCDDAPVICYNLFCRSPEECTCKPAFHKFPQ